MGFRPVLSLGAHGLGTLGYTIPLVVTVRFVLMQRTKPVELIVGKGKGGSTGSDNIIIFRTYRALASPERCSYVRTLGHFRLLDPSLLPLASVHCL